MIKLKATKKFIKNQEKNINSMNEDRIGEYNI
jgi:hypothetical protein